VELNATVKRLSTAVLYLETISSFLGSESNYHDWHFLWFSTGFQADAAIILSCAITASFHIPSNFVHKPPNGSTFPDLATENID
jgi:hypothetical protein